MAEEFGGQVRFVSENYGESALARQFGVKRYPAVFVNDVLVATPKDFGFYGKGEGDNDGRYAPLRSERSHTRFRADLTRVVSLLLAGKTQEARALSTAPDTGEVTTLPDLKVTDLEGRPITHADLAGRVVIVDFWATWCPPCRGTLQWLSALKKQYGDRLVVVAFAVESDEADVRKLAVQLNMPLRWAMRTPDVLRAFGDVSAVPTLLMFDHTGKTVAAYYGSTSEQHHSAEAKLAALGGGVLDVRRP